MSSNDSSLMVRDPGTAPPLAQSAPRPAAALLTSLTAAGFRCPRPLQTALPPPRLSFRGEHILPNVPFVP